MYFLLQITINLNTNIKLNNYWINSYCSWQLTELTTEAAEVQAIEADTIVTQGSNEAVQPGVATIQEDDVQTTQAAAQDETVAPENPENSIVVEGGDGTQDTNVCYFR